MGANYYGRVEWHCYNDCMLAGCPGHAATLASKHGAYYLVEDDGSTSEIYSDIGLLDAVSWTLWKCRGMVE